MGRSPSFCVGCLSAKAVAVRLACWRSLRWGFSSHENVDRTRVYSSEQDEMTGTTGGKTKEQKRETRDRRLRRDEVAVEK